MNGSRLLRLDVTCPMCLQAPALRAYPLVVAMTLELDPAEPLHTIKCQWCGTVYPVLASAYQRAS